MNNFIMYSGEFDPYKNLATETALTNRIQRGDICLFIWQNRHTVVIGRNQNAWKECRCELLRDEGGTLARRSTGGGAVYHDLGNLNFSFAASPERYDTESQLAMIVNALESAGIAACFTGRNDMTVDGRKFSGSAFKYTKTCSLHHGTLLVNADLDKLARYLRPSESKLKAKGIASVRSRVCNLSEFNENMTISALKSLLAEAFAEKHGETTNLSCEELDTDAICAEYSSWDWNYGQTPRFDVCLERRFQWGGLEIMLQLSHGAVESAEVYTDAMDAELSEKIKSALKGAQYGNELTEKLGFLPDAAKWLAEELPI